MTPSAGRLDRSMHALSPSAVLVLHVECASVINLANLKFR